MKGTEIRKGKKDASKPKREEKMEENLEERRSNPSAGEAPRGRPSSTGEDRGSQRRRSAIELGRSDRGRVSTNPIGEREGGEIEHSRPWVENPGKCQTWLLETNQERKKKKTTNKKI